jgi:hypothetical protein
MDNIESIYPSIPNELLCKDLFIMINAYVCAYVLREIKEIRLIDRKSGFRMSVPYKEFETLAEYKEYVEGMHDMLVNMGK